MTVRTPTGQSCWSTAEEVPGAASLYHCPSSSCIAERAWIANDPAFAGVTTRLKMRSSSGAHSSHTHSTMRYSAVNGFPLRSWMVLPRGRSTSNPESEQPRVVIRSSSLEPSSSGNDTVIPPSTAGPAPSLREIKSTLTGSPGATSSEPTENSVTSGSGG